MTQPTYHFTGQDGQPVAITGASAMKAYLADGGMEHLLPGGVPRSAAPAADDESEPEQGGE